MARRWGHYTRTPRVGRQVESSSSSPLQPLALLAPHTPRPDQTDAVVLVPSCAIRSSADDVVPVALEITYSSLSTPLRSFNNRCDPR